MFSSFIPAMLVGIRLLPIFVVAPILSFQRVPLTVRVILLMSLSIIFSSQVPLKFDDFIFEKLFSVFITEFVIGMSLAFGILSASAAIHTMGQLIDLQMGFSAATIFDPGSEMITSPTGELLTFAFVVVFFSLNMHHELLRGLNQLFHILPVGSSVIWQENWLKVLGSIYLLSFIIASPVIITLWLIDFSIAFVSRSLPQTPMYFIGLPVKVGLGILLLAWFLSNSAAPIYRLIESALGSWDLMFKV